MEHFNKRTIILLLMGAIIIFLLGIYILLHQKQSSSPTQSLSVSFAQLQDSGGIFEDRSVINRTESIVVVLNFTSTLPYGISVERSNFFITTNNTPAQAIDVINTVTASHVITANSHGSLYVTFPVTAIPVGSIITVKGLAAIPLTHITITQ